MRVSVRATWRAPNPRPSALAWRPCLTGNGVIAAHDVAVDGMGIRRAEVANQLVPGVISVSHPAGAASLALLGLSAAAATTKAVVIGSNSGQGLRKVRPAGAQQNQQAARIYVCDPIRAGVGGFSAGAAELITSGDGTVARADLRYVAFTMVALV
jgi:hypothetical protein